MKTAGHGVQSLQEQPPLHTLPATSILTCSCTSSSLALEIGLLRHQYGTRVRLHHAVAYASRTCCGVLHKLEASCAMHSSSSTVCSADLRLEQQLPGSAKAAQYRHCQECDCLLQQARTQWLDPGLKGICAPLELHAELFFICHLLLLHLWPRCAHSHTPN